MKTKAQIKEEIQNLTNRLSEYSEAEDLSEEAIEAQRSALEWALS